MRLLRGANFFIALALAPYGLAAPAPNPNAPQDHPSAQQSPSAPRTGQNTGAATSAGDDFKSTILDPAAEPATRVAVAGLLIRTGTTESFRTAAEILAAPPSASAAQKAVCEALYRVGTERPELLRLPGADVLADSAARLLAAEDAELRSKAAAGVSVFPMDTVLGLLEKPVADKETPEPQRLAAIDAIGRHVHRRRAAELLIGLLDDPAPAVVQRAIAALGPLSRGVAPRAEEWKGWWAAHAGMTEVEWLIDRVDALSVRERALDGQRGELQASLDRLNATIAAKVAELQGDLLFALPERDRDARLLAWLADPTPAVCGGALQVVLRRIGDSSAPPTDAVHAATIKLLQHASPDVRRRALQVTGATRDRSDAGPVLELVRRETDPITRLAGLAVLGQLHNPDAAGDLLREIQSPRNAVENVSAAAKALAEIAAGDDSGGIHSEDLTASADALKERYQRLGESGNGARPLLLDALAALASPGLEDIFQQALDRNDPALVRPAVRGLMRLANRGRNPQVRAMTTSTDSGLRLLACEALGTLGSEDADLESLLPRLKPGVEPQAGVRDAAWLAYRNLLLRRPIDQQWAWIERLSDVPSLQVAYFDALLGPNAPITLDPASTLRARRCACNALIALNRWADAVDPLQALFDALIAAQDADAADVAARLVEARLRGGRHDGLGECIARMADQSADAAPRIIDAVSRYLASEDARADRERTSRLVDQLRAVHSPALGSKWDDVVSAAGSTGTP